MDYAPALLKGLGVTLSVGVSSIALMLAVGFVIATFRRAPSRFGRGLSTVFVEFMRANSAIVLLFWVFYALPILPGTIQLTGVSAAILVLGINGGAYAAEIIRGAVKAIPQGQYDACSALGIGFWRRERRVVLPQMWRIALPSLSSMAIELFKWTSIVSFVGVPDLIYEAEYVRRETGQTVLVYVALIIVYYLMGRAIGAAFNLPTLSVRRRHRSAAARGPAHDIGLPVYFRTREGGSDG